jgi:hypothetical protein
MSHTRYAVVIEECDSSYGAYVPDCLVVSRLRQPGKNRKSELLKQSLFTSRA